MFPLKYAEMWTDFVLKVETFDFSSIIDPMSSRMDA